MKKLVIFDMDGLMIDSEKVTYSFYDEVMHERGYPFSLEMYKNFLGKNRVKVMRLLIEYYGESFPVQEIWDDIHLRVQNALKQHVPLKKGLIELLTYLKEHDYKIMVATSSDRWRVNEIFSSAKIESYFDDVICGNEVSKGKPDPEIFLTACKKAKVSPQEALVLEDSESGILAAYAGTIDVICIPDMKYPEKEYEEKTTIVLDSLLDVIPYLENTNKAAH